MPLTIVLRRWFYRAAVLLLRVYWFIARPSVTGVKFLLTDRDRVLLVRHTYGPKVWDVPGGKPKRHEPPEITARREAAEELGVTLDGWRRLGTVSGQEGGRRDTIICMSRDVRDPVLDIDLGEIEVARWFSRSGLPPDLGRYAAQILTLPSEPLSAEARRG